MPSPAPPRQTAAASTAGSPTAGDRLLAWFAGLDRVTVAYSGGVDSAVVLAAAVRALGPDRVTAATAVSPALPSGMLDRARALAADLGVAHREVPTAEMDVEGYARNDHDRCYFCKSTLVDALGAVLDGAVLDGAVLDGAGVDGTGTAAVVTGTNADDIRAGWRPGIRAAAERGARTPLADTGMSKAAVRATARGWDLDVWDRPASPCLSSRVAYGIRITPARLGRVDRAEVAVRTELERAGLACHDLRVRDLGPDGARIEVDATLVDAVAATGAVRAVRAAGFDGPVGVGVFTSGGLNTVLPGDLRHA